MSVEHRAIMPAEVYGRDYLPNEVYDVVNEMLLNREKRRAGILEEEILQLSIEKMKLNGKCVEFFNNPRWIYDVKDGYACVGWEVKIEVSNDDNRRRLLFD